MGCGCGGNKQTVTYQHVSAQGKVTNTRSQIEARAKQIREGGEIKKVVQPTR